MYKKTICAALSGLTTTTVYVETDISDGLPMFEMVGFLGSEVREARERVRTALKNSSISLPPKRITINLSPADLRKQGTAYDLPIAISILAALGTINDESLKDSMFIGELGLDGSVRPVTGVLPRVLHARSMQLSTCIIPAENTMEAAIIDGIKIVGVTSINDAVEYLKGNKKEESLQVDIKPLFNTLSSTNDLDFSDISGQPLVKRSIEIAASGLHNLLLVGPPGSGKTMAAKRVPSILPPLSYDEAIELTKIYSIIGKLPAEGLITKRPFVSPHHTSTPISLSGGGANPKPGAITQAHKSVLFLDELPEFSREALEVLRQPLEEHTITLQRSSISHTFPADFLLIAAMNPCKCGFYPDYSKCTCTPAQINRYRSKISGPLLDRIDLCVDVPSVNFDELSQKPLEETSEQIRERIMGARERQEHRFRDDTIKYNGRMDHNRVIEHCRLQKKEMLLLKEAFNKLSLSARAYDRILKTARTIADLEDSSNINEYHLSEAVSFRGSGILTSQPF